MKDPKIRFKGFRGEWETSIIGDMCSISTGKSNTQDKIEDGKYPFYVRSPYVERSNKFLFDEEAVLTVGDGVGTGKVFHYVNGKYDLHQRVYRMFDFRNIYAKYFYYYFSTKFYKRVMSMTAKSSVDSVRMDMIADMKIDYPSTAEQQSIASYFQHLDSLIQSTTKKIESLKQVKAASLQSMFPQEGETTPRVRFKGFEGEWEKVSFGQFGSVAMCKRIFKDQTMDKGEGPFYKIGTFAMEPDAYISKELFIEYKSKFSFPQKGDILISAAGTIGRTIQYNGEDAYFQDSNIVWLKHGNEIDNTFLMYIYSLVKWNGLEGATIKRLYNNIIL